VSRLRLRLASIAALLLVFGYLALANFASEETRLASPLLPDEGMRLGLDLQGGIHWVLGVKLEVAEKHELEFLADGLEGLTVEDGFEIETIDVEDGRLLVMGFNRADGQKVRDWADDHGGLRIDLDATDRIELTLADGWRQEVRERGMRQVLEVLRRRIDDPVTGIPESVVTRQGDDRILVQIPGGEIERERAGALLEVTGFLEFKIVREQAQTEDLLRANHPQGLPDHTEIVYERDKESDRVLGAYLVAEKADITGDYLTDARVQFDRQGRAIVGFTFNPEGGRIFGELTGGNVGEQLAIILDKRVYSAPAIRSQINMRGQIEGRFTTQEAADLAVVLRAGSLAVPVEIEEERTVGPALGADSIDRAGADPLLRDRLLPSLRRLRRSGALREPAAPGGGDVALRGDAHSAGAGGDRAHGGHGGGCERDHLRTDPGGAAGGEDPAGRRLHRLQQGPLDHPRREHHHPDHRPGALRVRNRADQGLRRDPLHRGGDQRVRGPGDHAGPVRAPSRYQAGREPVDLAETRCLSS
jgi:protein-export membrane protein SecD